MNYVTTGLQNKQYCIISFYEISMQNKKLQTSLSLNKVEVRILITFFIYLKGRIGLYVFYIRSCPVIILIFLLSSSLRFKI